MYICNYIICLLSLSLSLSISLIMYNTHMQMYSMRGPTRAAMGGVIDDDVAEATITIRLLLLRLRLRLRLDRRWRRRRRNEATTTTIILWWLLLSSSWLLVVLVVVVVVVWGAQSAEALGFYSNMFVNILVGIADSMI